MLTLDQLKQKLPILRQERDQHLANATAAAGMVLLCEALIVEWERPDTTPVIPEPGTPA